MQVDEEAQRVAHVGIERVSNVPSTDFPGYAPDEDQSWDLERFKNVRLVFHGILKVTE